MCFETPLDRVSKLGTGGFEGTRGYWIPLRGPKHLIVGTDAFMISAPQALREYVFTGGEASIAVSQAPSRRHVRDWIVITEQPGGRQVQLAITHDNLPDVWQALAGTGATLLSSEPPAPNLTRPWWRPARSGRYLLRRLAAALVIVLLMDTAAWLGAIALPSLGGLANFGFIVVVAMFVVWFYRARVNAEGNGWPQRRSPAWAIAGWIVPVVFLWFPFQIMADIWRAGLPAEARANRAILPGVDMLFGVLLAVDLHHGARESNLVCGHANQDRRRARAIMTALLVRKVSNGPLGR